MSPFQHLIVGSVLFSSLYANIIRLLGEDEGEALAQIEEDSDAQFKTTIKALALPFATKEIRHLRRKSPRCLSGKESWELLLDFAYVLRLCPPRKNLRCSLYSGETADIWFEFPNEKDYEGNPLRIGCHRVVLSVISDVFFDRFKSEWSQKNTLAIQDCTLQAYRALMEYIYTGSLVTAISSVRGFNDLCGDLNVLGLMILAGEHKFQQLAQQSMLLINLHFHEIDYRYLDEIRQKLKLVEVFKALRFFGKEPYVQSFLIAYLSFNITNINFWKVFTESENIAIGSLKTWVQR